MSEHSDRSPGHLEAFEDERERRVRNLQSIARHMQQGPEAPPAASEGKESGAASTLKRWGPVGMVLLLAAGKLKWLLALLKATKLTTLLTMFLMVGVYAQMWGLPFALGFVLLIFVHEMGHAAAMRQQGLAFGAPVFIPFVGAVIAMKGRPRDAWVEAIVGIGGPLLGTVGAALCLGVAWVSGSAFWYALAYVGFMINLFNMIPVSPLDGGRIVGVIHRALWLIGYLIGGAVFLATHSPLLMLILLLGLPGLWRMLTGKQEATYYDVPVQKRAVMGAAYFGLLLVMAGAMYLSQSTLEAQGLHRAALQSAEEAGLLAGLGVLFAELGPVARRLERLG